MAVRQRHGILALEGDWDDGLIQTTSIKGMVDLLRAGNEVPVIHYKVRNLKVLKEILKEWERHQKKYPIIYLTGHGSAGAIQLAGDKNEVKLTQIGRILGELKLKAPVFLIVGACDALKISKQEMQQFFTLAPKVSGLLGYEKSVDFIEATAFELILLDKAAAQPNFKKASLVKLHQELMKLARPLSRRLKRVLYA